MGTGATIAPYLAGVGILSLAIGAILYAAHPHSRRAHGSMRIFGQRASFSGQPGFVFIGIGIFLLAMAAVATGF